jgi:glycosyltransferase involved in cell wall biosynthesis
MRLSIITPTFNSSDTLEFTIQSVLAQNYPDLEYIVIDGESTDGTLDIIKKYQNNLKFISEKDQGIYDAMNKGLQIATGDLIGIINSDDCYLDSILRLISNIAMENPEADVFYGNVVYEISDRPLFLCKSIYPLKRYSFFTMPIIHPTVFVRRECYEKYGYFSTMYKLSSDHELMLRFFEAGVNFHYVNAPIVRMKAGGASNRNLDGLKEIYEILREKKASIMTYALFGLKFLRDAIVISMKQNYATRTALCFYHKISDQFKIHYKET